MKCVHGVPVLLALLFLQCAVPPPAPVFRLVPVEADFKWVYGEPMVSRADNGIEMSLRFVEQAGGNFVFDIEVWNFSADTILVAPDSFYYSYAIPQSSKNGKKSDGVRAHDPEQQMIGIEKAISTEHSRYAGAQMMNATISFIGLILDIATIGQPTSREEQQEREIRRYESRLSQLEEEARHRNTIADLERTRSMWQSVTLRKTTLYPDESVGGRVMFPVSDKARFLRLHLRVGNSAHTIEYEQQRQ